MKTRARWVEGFHELNGHMFDLERDGLSQVVLAQDSPCDDNTQPYHTGSVASRVNKDSAFRRTPGRRCEVCYWCIIEIRGRDNINIGTWNTRTLRATGKLQELTHAMDRYKWNILGLCEMSG